MMQFQRFGVSFPTPGKPFWRIFCGQGGTGGRGGGGGDTQVVHCRSRVTTDPRIPAMPGRSTSGFHQPGSVLSLCMAVVV